MKKRLILLDYMNIFYRSYFAHNDLMFAGKFTGTLYGFINAIATIKNELNSTDLVICTDCRPYYRMIDQPLYKANRKDREKDPEHEEKINTSHYLIKEFLDLLGLEVVGYKGLEADDLIAATAKIHSSSYDEVIAVTNDSDLYQLFTLPNFSIWRGKIKGFYTYENFKRDYDGLKPKQWVEVLAMAGGHNGLPNVPGIGIVTAIKIVKNPEGKLKAVDLIKYKKQIQLNKRLARLPYYKFKHWSYVRIPEIGKYNERKMIKFLAKNGIKFHRNLKEAFIKLHDK